VLDSEVVDDDSVEDTDPPPKAPRQRTGSSSSATPTNGKGATDATSAAGAAGAGERTRQDADDAEPGKRPQPRYDSRSFTTWIQNNPEKAAELASKVFKTQLGASAEGWKQHFISAENGRRRHAEQVDKDRAALDAQRAELDRLADEARRPINDVIDVIEAEQKEDFPAIDRFIETTFKVSFNDYCARRLRGLSKETNTERAQKQKIAQLERDLAAAKGSASGGDTGKGKDGASKGPPQVSQKWLESEIAEDHGVRELGGWQDKVRAAYAASYDEETDEYGLSIEDAAQQVFDAFLEKRTARPPAQGKGGKGQERRQQRREERREPAHRGRPRQGRTWTDDDEDAERTPAAELDDDQPPEDFAARTQWALDRAGRRR
jgi:hypothetical protein